MFFFSEIFHCSNNSSDSDSDLFSCILINTRDNKDGGNSRSEYVCFDGLLCMQPIYNKARLYLPKINV